MPIKQPLAQCLRRGIPLQFQRQGENHEAYNRVSFVEPRSRRHRICTPIPSANEARERQLRRLLFRWLCEIVLLGWLRKDLLP